jgi:hypothetical protein
VRSTHDTCFAKEHIPEATNPEAVIEQNYVKYNNNNSLQKRAKANSAQKREKGRAVGHRGASVKLNTPPRGTFFFQKGASSKVN